MDEYRKMANRRIEVVRALAAVGAGCLTLAFFGGPHDGWVGLLAGVLFFFWALDTRIEARYYSMLSALDTLRQEREPS